MTRIQLASIAVTLASAFVVSATCCRGDESLSEHKIRIGGVERTYFVHKTSLLSRPVPLVVVLHGGGGNGKGLRDTYGFKPFVASGEFIAVYPNAGKGGWLPEHVEFLDAVIDEVRGQERVDKERLFVTGASRGGLMTFIMVAESKHRFRAAGTVIASPIAGLTRDHPINQPVSFCMIAGTEDPLMPYSGGWGAMGKPKQTGDPDGRVLPVEDAIKLLLQANQISSKPRKSNLGNKDPEDGCTNELYQWSNAETGHKVALIKVIGGGHVVPGGRQYLPKSVIGPACNDFDHAEIMWKFFRSAEGETAHRVAKSKKPGIEDADAEQVLRQRVGEMYKAMLANDVDRCLQLTAPQVLGKIGRDKATKFFKTVNGLVKLAQLGPKDRSIKRITMLEDGKVARVELEVTKPRRSTSIELWAIVDGIWYYQETAK